MIEEIILCSNPFSIFLQVTEYCHQAMCHSHVITLYRSKTPFLKLDYLINWTHISYHMQIKYNSKI